MKTERPSVVKRERERERERERVPLSKTTRSFKLSSEGTID
jgi:hypothetical protein